MEAFSQHINTYADVDYGTVKIGEIWAYKNIYTLVIDSLDAGFYYLFVYSA